MPLFWCLLAAVYLIILHQQACVSNPHSAKVKQPWVAPCCAGPYWGNLSLLLVIYMVTCWYWGSLSENPCRAVWELCLCSVTAEMCTLWPWDYLSSSPSSACIYQILCGKKAWFSFFWNSWRALTWLHASLFWMLVKITEKVKLGVWYICHIGNNIYKSRTKTEAAWQIKWECTLVQDGVGTLNQLLQIGINGLARFQAKQGFRSHKGDSFYRLNYCENLYQHIAWSCVSH